MYRNFSSRFLLLGSYLISFLLMFFSVLFLLKKQEIIGAPFLLEDISYVSSLICFFLGFSLVLRTAKFNVIALFFLFFILLLSVIYFFSEGISEWIGQDFSSSFYRGIEPYLIEMNEESLFIPFSFFIATLSLFLICIGESHLISLWLVGLLGSLLFGIAMIFLVAFLAEVPTEFFLLNKTPMPIGLSLILLGLACYFIGLGGRKIYLHYPHNLRWWSSVITTLICLMGILSSWWMIRNREYKLIYEEMEATLSLVQEVMDSRLSIYFQALARIERRWERDQNDDLALEAWKEAIQSLQIYYPSLMLAAHLNENSRIDFAEKKGSDFLKNFDVSALSRKSILEDKESIFSLEPLGDPDYFFKMNDEVNPQAQVFVGKIFRNFQAPLLIVFSSMENTRTQFVVVTDLYSFLKESIPQVVTDLNEVEISYGSSTLLASLESPTESSRKFQVFNDWNFRGLPLEIRIWPRSNRLSEIENKAAHYHLIIGIIFSVCLGGCVYFLQFARVKRAEAEAANLEKSFFLANMSHELRTPLHAIIGGCSILQTLEEPQAMKKWIGVVGSSSQILLGLINELLDLSKIELGHGQSIVKEIQTKAFLQEATALYQEEAKEKNVVVSIELEESCPEKIRLDHVRFRQVIQNLLSNAVKYTDEGIVKLIVGLKKKDVLELVIQDSGIGMSPNEQTKIFEKYKSIDMRREQGTGLGLAIVMRALEVLKGTIEVESELGKGSRFIVWIPFQEI